MQLSKLAILVLVFFWAPTSLAEERTEVHLFQYGRTNTDLLQTAFKDFRDMLTDKIPKLSSEILKTKVQVPGLSRLRLKSVLDEKGDLERPEPRVGSLEAKRKYWLETGALSVLTGYIRERGDTPYAYSTFFWGKLKGPYPDEMITLKMPLGGESFDDTSDSHSVAVLYALAQRSRNGCDNASDIAKLLSEARKRAKAIAGDLPELSDKLVAIVSAANDEIESECSGD